MAVLKLNSTIRRHAILTTGCFLLSMATLCGPSQASTGNQQPNPEARLPPIISTDNASPNWQGTLQDDPNLAAFETAIDQPVEPLGLRESWASRGVTFQNNVTQFYMGNTSGGVEREFRYGGHGDYVTNIDFGKLLGKDGLFLKVRAEHRFGESLSGVTGAILPSNLAADLPVPEENDLYITNFAITQALSENVLVFAGKIDSLDGDINAFAHGRGIRQFSNVAFIGTPIAMRTIPYSTLATGFAVLKNGAPFFSFSAINPTDTARTSGLGELYSEGVVLASELRLTTNLFGMTGHQLFGGTWSSREYVALDQDPRVILPPIPIAPQQGSWSAYWNCDQFLVQNPENPAQGWGYFARAGVADDATNPIFYFLSAGLGGSSPLPNRSADSFGIGYYYSATSNKIAPFLDFLLGGLDDGHGGEFFYNIALSKSITVTPDLQVIKPARTSIDTALVAGLRVNIAF